MNMKVRIDKLLEETFVGKTLTGKEFCDYEDLGYYQSIGVEPAILPSRIKEAFISKDDDGDFLYEFHLENGTVATAYDNEDVYLQNSGV